MVSLIRPLPQCVVCNSCELEVFLDLGDQVLANDYSSQEGVNDRFPLRVARCVNCTHCQLSHVVSPQRLFSTYPYVSGTSRTLRDYFRRFAVDAWTRHLQFKSVPRVLDIACNDGALLEEFRNLGCDIVGVDPAENLRELTIKKEIAVHTCYWDNEVAERVGRFDLITAFNVLAHTAMPFEFLVACRTAMKRGGRLYFQTSQHSWLERGEFDCIYHEHISYFTDASVQTLVRRAGFSVESIEKPEIHGGSNLVCLRSVFQDIGLRVDEFKCQSLNTVERLRSEKWTVCGYGAAAKGSVVLQFTALNLDWIADENPLKIGQYMPGTTIPIVGAERIGVPEKLAVVLLAWNFAEEIKSKVLLLRGSKPTCFVTLPESIHQ